MAETILAYALTTLAQMKTELGIETANTTDDERIIRAINAATDYAESYTGRTLVKRSTSSTIYLDGSADVYNGGTELWVPEWPLESISDITSIHDDIVRAYGTATLIANTNYFVAKNRYIRLYDNGTKTTFNEGIQNIKLVYKPGYTTAPVDLQKAAILIAREFYLWEKNQMSNISSLSHDGNSASFKPDAINATALKILDIYKRSARYVDTWIPWVR